MFPRTRDIARAISYSRTTEVTDLSIEGSDATNGRETEILRLVGSKKAHRTKRVAEPASQVSNKTSVPRY